MKYEVLPLKPDHYVEAVGEAFPWMDAWGVASGMGQGGPAYTGLVDGRIAVCAGVLIPWPGLGHCWAHVTDLGRAHRYFVTSAVVRHLRAIIHDHHLGRLTADVVASCQIGRLWVERMGFEFEADMPRYGPNGEDFVRYRWIRPGS